VPIPSGSSRVVPAPGATPRASRDAGVVSAAVPGPAGILLFAEQSRALRVQHPSRTTRDRFRRPQSWVRDEPRVGPTEPPLPLVGQVPCDPLVHYLYSEEGERRHRQSQPTMQIKDDPPPPLPPPSMIFHLPSSTSDRGQRLSA